MKSMIGYQGTIQSNMMTRMKYRSPTTSRASSSPKISNLQLTWKLMMDPQEHMDTFKSRMALVGASDPIRCNAFLIMLKKVALKWFNSCHQGPSTSSRTSSLNFWLISQPRDLSQSRSLVCWDYPNNKENYFEIFSNDLMRKHWWWGVGNPSSSVNLIKQAPTWCLQGLAIQASSKDHGWNPTKGRKAYIPRRNAEGHNELNEKSSWEKAEPTAGRASAKEAQILRVGRYHDYIAFTVSLADLYKEIGQVERSPKPKGLRVKVNTSRSLFCEYHNSFGHNTKDCYDLWDVVEQLIREGRLLKYIAFERSLRKRKASPIKDEERRNPRA